MAADAPDFTKDVAPILTKYCTGCHNDADREGKLFAPNLRIAAQRRREGRSRYAGASGDVSRLVLSAHRRSEARDAARRGRKTKGSGNRSPEELDCGGSEWTERFDR